MPGPTGAKKRARTSIAGPLGKCGAPASKRAAPASPTKRVGSSALDGSNTSKGFMAPLHYESSARHAIKRAAKVSLDGTAPSPYPEATSITQDDIVAVG